MFETPFFNRNVMTNSYCQPCQSLFVAPCSHVWHYRCIRPILTDPKTFPSFLCPNCRAVTDLNADVDEPVDAGWDESVPQPLNEEDHQQISDIMQAGPITNGTSRSTDEVHKRQDSEDDIINAMASTNLAFRDDDSPIEPSGPSTRQRMAQPQAPQPLPSSNLTRFPNSTPPSILNRRNAQRCSPSLSPNLEPSSYGNYLRPITPTAPLSVDSDLPMVGTSIGGVNGGAGDGENSNLARVLTPTTTENFVGDGPMTPTNSVGPFIFDGSAGRTASAEGAEE